MGTRSRIALQNSNGTYTSIPSWNEMGTRSRIAIQNSNGTYTSIYCHWDGYPSWNGKQLLEHYMDESKVRALMELGDLSNLGSELGSKHDFNTHVEAERTDCLAYGRDRGEQNVSADMSSSIADLTDLTYRCGAEYLYVFRKGEWSYKSVPWNGGRTRLRKLTQKACQES